VSVMEGMRASEAPKKKGGMEWKETKRNDRDVIMGGKSEKGNSGPDVKILSRTYANSRTGQRRGA